MTLREGYSPGVSANQDNVVWSIYLSPNWTEMTCNTQEIFMLRGRITPVQFITILREAFGCQLGRFHPWWTEVGGEKRCASFKGVYGFVEIKWQSG